MNKFFLFFLFLIFLLFSNICPVAAVEKVLIVKVDGPITGATVELLKDALKEDSDLIILTLDTTGGALSATFEIMRLIEHSEVPIVGYVYPKGAKSWSAGTFILLSTHVAAMSPYSVIGSSQPVSMGLGESQMINDSKIINALIALLKESMRMHNRNVSIAPKFITENLNLNNEEAKRAGVIEFSARNIDDLLKKIDNYTVNTTKGEVIISTKNPEIKTFEPSIRVKFMGLITDPTVASIILMIGIYALIFGLSNPGIGSEVLGVLLVLLGLIGMGFDVNVVGILLILVGAGLVLFEFSTPGFGILGVAGIFALTIGVVLMGPVASPNWTISKSFQDILLLSVAVPSIVFGLFLLFALYKVAEVKFKKPAIGAKMFGEIVKTEDDISNEKEGYIRYDGELWKAKVSDGKKTKIRRGDKVKIVGREEGDILIVESV